MADLSGRLNIELQRLNGSLRATIRSSRPTAASRVFVGKTVEETVAGLPSLFSVCATAQACACVSACEAALDRVPSSTLVRLRRLLVDLETVKEHLWRMLLDWPRFVEEPPQEQAMSTVMAVYFRLRALLTRPPDPLRLCADAALSDLPAAIKALDELEQLSAKHVLGAHPSDWLTRLQCTEDLFAWAKRTDRLSASLVRQVLARGWVSAGRNRVTALPALTAAELEIPLSGADADRFSAAPLWRDEPRESSPFARQGERAPVAQMTRQFGNGLLPRLAAQLVELASLQRGLRVGLEQLDEPAEPLADGTGAGVGIAQVAAARGLLVHRVAVDEGRICDYSILAPTEWNFHPRGAVVQGLSALPVADAATLERQASLFVTVVDPCVDYHVAVS